VIDLRRTTRFDKDFDGLPERIQEAVLEKLRLFVVSPRHPSLRLKRVCGSEHYWEMSVTMQYRIALAKVSETEFELLRAGTHKILERL